MVQVTACNGSNKDNSSFLFLLEEVIFFERAQSTRDNHVANGSRRRNVITDSKWRLGSNPCPGI
jgi:hypothetical protein